MANCATSSRRRPRTRRFPVGSRPTASGSSSPSRARRNAPSSLGPSLTRTESEAIAPAIYSGVHGPAWEGSFLGNVLLLVEPLPSGHVVCVRSKGAKEQEQTMGMTSLSPATATTSARQEVTTMTAAQQADEIEALKLLMA